MVYKLVAALGQAVKFVSTKQDGWWVGRVAKQGKEVKRNVA